METTRRIVVLGGGESGAGAAVLAKVKGMDVWLSDMGTIAPKYKALLDKYEIAWEEGQHTEAKVLAAHEIIKSPGIPDNVPILQKAATKNIPVISEIEFAGRYTDAKMVCITGSNGKTTTTMLTYHILTKAGLNVGLAGNVGNSLALQVATEQHDVYVIELSSFQLDNMYQFKANVAVLLNITPDHLDRYDFKMENYAASKFRIMQNQGAADAFIYWQGDPIIDAQLKHVHTEAKLLAFDAVDDESLAAYVDKGDTVKFHIDGHEWEIPRGALSIKGLHNVYNSMAAGLSASCLHIKDDVIRRALADFEAVEHRLEFVRTVNGVTYINDSKATNVNACYYALESMTTPVVLILGGKDKGNDYTELLEFVGSKVRAIVCLGADNAKLLNFFEGKVPVLTETHSMPECLAKCQELAQEGDTVLLSPCCASFDLFRNMEDRGEQFKNGVKEIEEVRN
ncbi:MAG: UDP-N-acetylmuramoyl-L-alanine--D-glutamate ligase [Bacteroidales bacterium]|nr:UDP-N-acetylmuramoyl-L-alanine--D-glutamate ligase [Bacteroidales bacterium]